MMDENKLDEFVICRGHCKPKILNVNDFLNHILKNQDCRSLYTTEEISEESFERTDKGESDMDTHNCFENTLHQK